MTTPLISVIMPTYNRAEMLGGALESLIHQETGGEFAYEIVVIDNASTDSTKSIVEAAAACSQVPVRYCFQEEPGPAAARNCGLAHARGEWLAFFDDDELAAPNWLEQLYRAAMDSRASIVGGAMQLALPSEVINGLSRFVRVTSLREIDYYPTGRIYGHDRLPGTNNALVARHAFQSIGAFDASIASGGSDSDFFMRARAAGIQLYYTPHAIVRHRVAPNRLTKEYFRWDAQQGCNAFAGLDFQHRGRAVLLWLCLARLAHALLVVVPQLAWSRVRHDKAGILGQKVRLWRAEGYARRTLSILAPKLFPQHAYFGSLSFRRGRLVGQQRQSTSPAACESGKEYQVAHPVS